jgi:hypothetical protein
MSHVKQTPDDRRRRKGFLYKRNEISTKKSVEQKLDAVGCISKFGDM